MISAEDAKLISQDIYTSTVDRIEKYVMYRIVQSARNLNYEVEIELFDIPKKYVFGLLTNLENSGYNCIIKYITEEHSIFTINWS